jgi:hypothetical protein
MLGSISDVERDRELSRSFVSLETDMRPDLLGGIIGVRNDGRFARAMYFSSEAEARAGEQSEVPEEMAAASPRSSSSSPRSATSTSPRR